MVIKIDEALVANLKLTLLPDYHDGVKELFLRYVNKIGDEATAPSWDLGRNAKFLLQKVLPEPRWAVHNLVAEGLNLFVGRPKARKSFFALQMACRVAEGKQLLGYNTRKGKVLYISLEDEEQRLQRRLLAMGYTADCNLENLYFEYTSTWKRFYKKDVIAIITQYLKHWDGEVSLVIIDTLQRFRGWQEYEANSYAADYNFMNGLQEMASSTNTPIVCVHHTRKATTGDYISDGSGTMGIAGGCDSVMTLYREHNENHALLKGGGRDVTDFEKWMVWDDEFCTFYPIREEDVPSDAKNKDVTKQDLCKLVLLELVIKKGRIAENELLNQVGSSCHGTAESTIKRTLVKLLTDGVLHADGKGDRRPISLSKAK